MAEWSCSTPVCFLIFKRPDTTEQVFEAIRQAKPRQLFVVADGPRSHVPGEAAQCAATRAIIDRVDWDCEVVTNYAPVNLGCKQRVASGLNWLFEQVEEAIILEDDCLPEPSFFRFCEELLQRYRRDPRVMSISGNNFQLGQRRTAQSYYFSIHPSIWGWATWRRAWQHYDLSMEQWPTLRDQGWLTQVWPDPVAVACWTKIFDFAHRGLTSWDYPWTFTCWRSEGLTIVPNVNLVTNLGFNENATGNVAALPPLFVNLFSQMPIQAVEEPFIHPLSVNRQIQADQFTQNLLHNLYWRLGGWEFVVHETAQFWLGLPETRFDSYLTAYIRCMLKSKPMMDAVEIQDQRLAEQVKQQVAQGLDHPKGLNALLVAMLYYFPHQLELPVDLTRIPNWLLEPYVQYLLQPPPLFQEVGEIEAYVQYLRRWVNYLHDQILRHPDSQRWQQIADTFTRSANFIPLYFTSHNLKDLYAKRSAIMAFSLTQQGHVLDYEFPERGDRPKIRLGILAAHYSPQTETFSTLPAYKHLDREAFEIVLFSTVETQHRLERYCAGHADAFVVLPSDLAEQVQVIRQADLDVLLIATNVTAVTNHIAQLALHRLARVQIVNNSSCTTTGMSSVDYFISGTLTESEEAQAHYTETLLLLDGAAHCYDFATEVNVRPTEAISRKTLGIQPHEVVYISGANFFKITPEVMQVWATILATVPDAKLILYPFNPNWSNAYPKVAFQQQLEATLSAHQVDPDRLILLDAAPSLGDVKARLKLADVYLNAFPFSGVTSLLDPLQVGLPAIVMDGDTFRSRMGAAFMQEIHQADLVVANEAAYIQLAVALGTQPARRQQHRMQIQQAMANRPRFLDSHHHSQQMGALFHQVFHQQQATIVQQAFRLRQTNLIAFPDWTQPEDDLFQLLADLLRSVVTQSVSHETALLLYIGQFDEAEADMAISSVLMYLLTEEMLEVSDDGPDVVLLTPQSALQWQSLMPQITARVVLEAEDAAAIAESGADTLTVMNGDRVLAPL